jgi:hypothetical protein
LWKLGSLTQRRIVEYVVENHVVAWKDGGPQTSHKAVQQPRYVKNVYYEAVLEDGLAIGALDSLFHCTRLNIGCFKGLKGI